MRNETPISHTPEQAAREALIELRELQKILGQSLNHRIVNATFNKHQYSSHLQIPATKKNLIVGWLLGRLAIDIDGQNESVL